MSGVGRVNCERCCSQLKDWRFMQCLGISRCTPTSKMLYNYLLTAVVGSLLSFCVGGRRSLAVYVGGHRDRSHFALAVMLAVGDRCDLRWRSSRALSFCVGNRFILLRRSAIAVTLAVVAIALILRWRSSDRFVLEAVIRCPLIVELSVTLNFWLQSKFLPVST